MNNQKTYRIYNVENYCHLNADNRDRYCERYTDIKKVCNKLSEAKFYHSLIKNNIEDQYTLFADVDGYNLGIKDWTKKFFEYLGNNYGIILNKDKRNYSYTKNTVKEYSYHVSFPMFSCNIKNMKILMTGFKKHMEEKFNIKKGIDTTIYSDHWYRLPNQYKGDKSAGFHEIKKGIMEHFIPEYVNSEQDLNMIVELVNNKKNEDKEKLQKKKEVPESVKINLDFDSVDNRIKFINDCLNILDSKYYDEYENWYKIGMILKSQEVKFSHSFLDMFKSFSQKSEKYCEGDVMKLWNKIDVSKVTINISSLYYYARESDLQRYKNLRIEYYKNNKIDITEMYLAKKINEISGHYFIYVQEILYCFCDKTNKWFKSDDLLYSFLEEKVYPYMVDLLNDSYVDINFITSEQKKLHSLCKKATQQKNVVLKYKQLYCREDHNIKFDNMPYLFGFKDCVYDILNNEVRNYEYSDYMTLNTGYNFEEAKREDVKFVKEMIKKIMPDDDKRKLLYQILSSGIINKQFQKFILFNGCGGNGKSFLNKFMKKTLGEYMYNIDPKFLTSSQNSNGGEIALMHNKRYVLSSEPSENLRIEGNIIKNLTGNESIQSRMLYQNASIIDLKCTMILECNKRPCISEQTEAIRRRLIDIDFTSIFTDKINEVDEEKHIYLANKNITEEKLESLKHALFRVLRNEAKKFIENYKEVFCIPNSIEARTNKYIDSCNPYDSFLDEFYTFTDNKDDVVKISDIFNGFKLSNYYLLMKRDDKKECTKQYLINYFSSHYKIKYHYRDRYQRRIENNLKENRNCLIGYKFKTDDDS